MRAWVLAVLRTRAVRALRAHLRHLLWLAKGAGMRNPPLPQQVDSILFVCKGNICRSPFAEHVARRHAREAGLEHIRFLSAGITANQAASCPLEAVDVAASMNVALDGHRPTRLTQAIVDEVDLLVVMEPAQVDEVGRHWPTAREKVWLLPLLDPLPADAYERCHIVDPFGQPREAYERCYERIDRATREMVTVVTSASAGPSGAPGC